MAFKFSFQSLANSIFDLDVIFAALITFSIATGVVNLILALG